MADSQTGTYALKVGCVGKLQLASRCYQNLHILNNVWCAGWSSTDVEGRGHHGRHHS